MDESKAQKERRGQAAKIIEHMLDGRKQLLSLLLQVSNHEPDHAIEPAQETLEEFCQVLVDYIAAGHFGLYERIIDGTERRKEVSDLALQVYPRIDDATQAALAFNEKYDANNTEVNLVDIEQDLSHLGEQLTTRIELEDQLINKLFGHGDTVPI